MNVYYKHAYYLLSEISQDYLPNGIKDYIEKELKRMKNDFKFLKSDVEIEKQKEIDLLWQRIEIIRNEIKREQSNKKHWIDKYSELEQFVFDLLHSNDNLNIKYGSKFDKIRNK
tara:strand:+ start:186 stop:527 length:342 start_codon:yes stop_codon:yes gene_type:complete